MRLGVLVGLVAAIVPLASLQGQAPPPGLKVQDLMSVQEFQRAGLTKLSPEELQQLNSWLVKFAMAVLQTSSGTSGSTSATSAVIESRIDGEFTGWEGETIFKLQNGQIWQQSSYAYKYKYAYSPKVMICRSGAGYRMKVDGVDGEIWVRQLR